MEQESSKYQLPILLYDSECQLCTRFKDAISALDRENIINPVSIHDEEIYNEFSTIKKDDCHERVHLIDDQKNVHQGPEVISFLAKSFPGVSKFSWLLDSNMGKKAIEIFYDSVSNYRKHSSSCSGCRK